MAEADNSNNPLYRLGATAILAMCLAIYNSIPQMPSGSDYTRATNRTVQRMYANDALDRNELNLEDHTLVGLRRDFRRIER